MRSLRGSLEKLSKSSMKKKGKCPKCAEKDKEILALSNIIISGKRANKYLREEIEDLRGRLDVQY